MRNLLKEKKLYLKSNIKLLHLKYIRRYKTKIIKNFKIKIMELQKKYYKNILENYSIHCENDGDYNSFKNLINNNLCFQKNDNLIIDNIKVNWCYYKCISNYWTPKLIGDLLLPVDLINLNLNNFSSKDDENNLIEYCYFENFNDFLKAKEEFLLNFK